MYAGKNLIAEYDSGALIYHGHDRLSNRLNMNSSGTVVGQQGHFPFGEDWYMSGTTTNRHFTAYRRDTESGNDYAKFRYHVNRLGRFLTIDPVRPRSASPQLLNRYSYVASDPVNRSDPGGQLYGATCDVTFDPGCIPLPCGDGTNVICGEGCDPTWGCTEPGGGGGGSGCGISMLLGDGEDMCDPEPVEPPPAPPAPNCYCILRLHAVKLTGHLATHSFWDVTDLSSQEWILTAGPSNSGPFPPYGNLTATAAKGGSYGPNKNTNTPFLPYDFGPSASYCYNAEVMVDLALYFEYFQNGTIPYHIRGPNSNSFAHSLGYESALPVGPIGPPRAEGWNYPLYIGP